jgi:hypothetical protein
VHASCKIPLNDVRQTDKKAATRATSCIYNCCVVRKEGLLNTGTYIRLMPGAGRGRFLLHEGHGAC